MALTQHDRASGDRPRKSKGWREKIAQRRVISKARRVDARFEHTLGDIRDEELPDDVRLFHDDHLPEVDYDRLLRAARVAKHPKTYEDVCRMNINCANIPGLVNLSGEERKALLKEHTSVLSEPGMLIVILTVSLAALLQGHVQSSINSASIFPNVLEIAGDIDGYTSAGTRPEPPTLGVWQLGITNATPFLAAAVLGCWIALPLSDRLGRRGSMTVAACMVLLTSIAMSISVAVATSIPKWQLILAVRIVNGIGMGIKAVNTPLLASETAIGYWRGTSILAWQLWVAFGIMVGFIFNTIFAVFLDNQPVLVVALILGAPIVPSVMLLLALCVCPESPRYHMRAGNYSPSKAYKILKRLRRCELIALRDIYVLHKSLYKHVQAQTGDPKLSSAGDTSNFIKWRGFLGQFLDLFRETRLRNALISSSIVALSQQLCGINILAFYSGTIFSRMGNDIHGSLYYSIGFGAVNFLFGIPAWRTIDTVGRRKWLVATLVPMAIMMAGASASFAAPAITTKLVAVFLYLHAALYSPGLGPIPFTLSAESFPLTHREVGCAFAISVNLFFAGLLTLLLPSLTFALTNPGLLGVFAFLNLLSFVLVFLFVEETRQVSLEDLDSIFKVPKLEFTSYQLFTYLPWVLGQYVPWAFRRWTRRTTPSGCLGNRVYKGRLDLEPGVTDVQMDRVPEAPQLYTQPVEQQEYFFEPDDPRA